MKMFRKEEGFTLVELMVVVLIIGILVAIAIPVFLNASANAQLKSCQATQRTIEGAIQTYNSTDVGVTTPYADSTGALMDSSSALVGANGTIKAVPFCPAGNKTSQYYDTKNGIVDGDISTVAGTGVWATPTSGAHKHF